MELRIRQRIIKSKDYGVRKIKEKREAVIELRDQRIERCLSCVMPQHIDSNSMRRKDV
ncbi:MAG: hypothetical protein NUK57_08515 [Gudongella sp.]|nr:hypothetical protein [Gudongella sp.]